MANITLGATPVSTAGSGTATVAATITGTTAGNSLVILCTWFTTTTTISSITISGESNATLVGSPGNNTSGGTCTQSAYLANITTGGSHTVTLTLSASSSNPQITVIEIVGANKSSMVDNNGTFSTAAVLTNNISTTLTTANANSALFASLQADRGCIPSNGAGFTGVFAGTFAATEYKLNAGAAGSQGIDFVHGAGTALGSISSLAINVDPNTSITPGVGSLALTGFAPALTRQFVISPSTGALTLAGFAPSTTNRIISPSVGSLALTGFAPTVTVPLVIIPAVGSMALTGIAPTVVVPIPRTPSVGSMALTGIAPTLGVSVPPSLLLRTLSAYGTPAFSASFDLLLRTLVASGTPGLVGSVRFTAPLRTIVVGGNDGARFTTPLRTLSATAVVGALGTVSFTTPLRSLAATGMMQVIASVSFQTLLRTLSSSAIFGIIGSASFATPRRTLSASGLVGIAANIAFTSFLRTLDSNGYRALTGTAQFSLPLRYLVTSGFPSVAENYRAWVMNARTGSLVEYDNFEFNSVIKFGNQYIASGPGGVYVLGGDDDAGAEIASTIRTGLPDYGSSFLKRLPRIYVSGTFEGDMYFSTISSEDGQRDYALTDNRMTGEQQRRVPIGKGPKSVRWQLEIRNKDGAKFGVSKMIVYPKTLGRRIQ